MSILGCRSYARVPILAGCGLIGLFGWQVGRGLNETGAPAVRIVGVIPLAVAYSAPALRPSVSNDELARTDPLGLLQLALQRYQNSISDYTCVFTKQERIGGVLGKEQQIQVRFREMPFSVFMEWIRNPGDARRVLYVKGLWQNERGDPLAKIEPEGVIARLLVKSVMLPINGPSARAASRRTIDLFGFANAMRLIIDYTQTAIKTDKGGMVYAGEGQVEGRRTWILKRTLAYSGDGGPWPDRILIVHIDSEWLLPVACYTFADDARQIVLARYVFSNVQLNKGLGDADFDAQANGF
jgi:hypothetical protein